MGKGKGKEMCENAFLYKGQGASFELKVDQTCVQKCPLLNAGSKFIHFSSKFRTTRSLELGVSRYHKFEGQNYIHRAEKLLRDGEKHMFASNCV